MKKIINSLIAALFVAVSFAQTPKDVTRFMGIPVDGTKPDMIKKLQDKGFAVSHFSLEGYDLYGEFNGANVQIHIITNSNRVFRVMLCDAYWSSKENIIARFNKLCQQFQKNGKYIPASRSTEDYIIPDDEDISHEMTVHNKQYEAVFYQLPDTVDSSDASDAEQPNMVERITKKVVWLKIAEHQERHYIYMFYDNEYNRADGEDL